MCSCLLEPEKGMVSAVEMVFLASLSSCLLAIDAAESSERDVDDPSSSWDDLLDECVGEKR